MNKLRDNCDNSWKNLWKKCSSTEVADFDDTGDHVPITIHSARASEPNRCSGMDVLAGLDMSQPPKIELVVWYFSNKNTY